MTRDSTLEALAGARHSDPFSVLGPHVEADGVVIRTIDPAAERIAVTRTGSDPVPMTRQHPGGVFEARLPRTAQIPDYRLTVTYPDGVTVDVDDPYRYGRVITDFDLYLFG